MSFADLSFFLFVILAVTVLIFFLLSAHRRKDNLNITIGKVMIPVLILAVLWFTMNSQSTVDDILGWLALAALLPGVVYVVIDSFRRR